MMQAHSPIPGSSTLDMHPDEHSHTSMSMDICDMQERYKSTPSERNLGNNSTTSSSASTPNKMRSASPPCHMVNFQSDGHAGHRSVVVSSPNLGRNHDRSIHPYVKNHPPSTTTSQYNCSIDDNDESETTEYSEPTKAASSAATTTTVATSAAAAAAAVAESPVKSYYVPLEQVGKNYRSLRRRGAAVHSQLLKSAFEASMSSYNTDDDSDNNDDDYSMYASNSTLASRDGIAAEEQHAVVNAPRKRFRSVGGNTGAAGSNGVVSGAVGGYDIAASPSPMHDDSNDSSADNEIGQMFGNMKIERMTSSSTTDEAGAMTTNHPNLPFLDMSSNDSIDNSMDNGQHHHHHHHHHHNNDTDTQHAPITGRLSEGATIMSEADENQHHHADSHVHIVRGEREHRNSATSISTTDSMHEFWQDMGKDCDSLEDDSYVEYAG